MTPLNSRRRWRIVGVFVALVLGGVCFSWTVTAQTTKEPPKKAKPSKIPFAPEEKLPQRLVPLVFPPITLPLSVPTTEDDPLVIPDIDSVVPKLNVPIDRIERQPEINVPGLVDPAQAFRLAPLAMPLINVPVPKYPDYGLIDGPPGIGGLGPPAQPTGFAGRKGSSREQCLRNGGGTRESEAAVERGLNWLVRTQKADGSWKLDGTFSTATSGPDNEIAATAFGLLPFLAAGYTHKDSKDNPFAKSVGQGLRFLTRQQKANTGEFKGYLYSDALATLALCEAYGLTQDPMLRRHAQKALDFLVFAQHVEGGWRYQPKQAGDVSVTGWVVQALKSGTLAGLSVPTATFQKAERFLDRCTGDDEGYGYTGKGSTTTMTAVGLLCRQTLQPQQWGPRSVRLHKSVKWHLEKNPPGKLNNMYYHYYATQVMYHFGGQAWKDWNNKMRDGLIARQEKAGVEAGSWVPHPQDSFSKSGGRLMETSLCLLTLEVYYRYPTANAPALGAGVP